MLDYITAGSIGFAQVGTDFYLEKQKVETNILLDIIQENEIFKVPKELQNKAYFRMKKFYHDFGSYKELCVIYDRDEIEDDEEMNDIFWNWFYEVESFDYESEEIMERCRVLFNEMYPMRVIKGGKNDNDDLNLKIS